MTRIAVRVLDFVTMRNVLHLPPAIHWRLVTVANRLAERV